LGTAVPLPSGEMLPSRAPVPLPLAPTASTLKGHASSYAISLLAPGLQQQLFNPDLSTDLRPLNSPLGML
jgi:hypothetical protein